MSIFYSILLFIGIIILIYIKCKFKNEISTIKKGTSEITKEIGQSFQILNLEIIESQCQSYIDDSENNLNLIKKLIKNEVLTEEDEEYIKTKSKIFLLDKIEEYKKDLSDQYAKKTTIKSEELEKLSELQTYFKTTKENINENDIVVADILLEVINSKSN